VIATAAFTTMFSTTLTVVDSFPRVWKGYAQIWSKKQETNQIVKIEKESSSERVYLISMILIATGAIIIQLYFISAFKSLIDLATILSFLTAPILAFMNYKVMQGNELPVDATWSKKMNILAKFGIAFLLLFSLIYLVWLFL
jgi:Mn2+/Fe2+ NRAMP family transporter